MIETSTKVAMALAAGLLSLSGAANAQWGHANSTPAYPGAVRGAGQTASQPAWHTQPARATAQTQYTQPLRGGLTVVPQGGYFDPGYAASERRQHLGTDYRAASGTPVFAIAGGQVQHNTTSQTNPYNSQVTVRQTDSTQTVYGHIYSTTTPGQTLSQGQYMGYVQGPNPAQPNYAPHLHLGNNTQLQDIQGGWGRAPITTTPQQARASGWNDPDARLNGTRR